MSRKAGRYLCGAVLGAALGAGLALAADVCRVRRAQAKLDASWLYRLTKRMADIRGTDAGTVIAIPPDMLPLERLRVCAHVLLGKK